MYYQKGSPVWGYEGKENKFTVKKENSVEKIGSRIVVSF
jgi:hypothetical protein